MTGAAADAVARPRPQEDAGAFAYLDVAALVLALPIVLLAGAPLVGFGLASAGWLAARALGFGADRLAARYQSPQRAILVSIAALFGRLWIVALAVILAARIGDDKDGLVAVLVIAGAFTAYLAVSILFRPRPAPGAGAPREEER